MGGYFPSVSAVWGLPRSGPLLLGPLVFLGDISYSIYINHLLVYLLIDAALPVLRLGSNLAGLGVTNSVAALLGMIVAIVILSAATYRDIEVPARYYLRLAHLPGIAARRL